MNESTKIYSVSWGLGSGVRRVRVRAEDALDACARIRDRYGWRRTGSYTVDARTRGDLCCEMLVERANGSQTLLVATSLEDED